METQQNQQPDTWAIVELFGHTRIAGRISEHTIGGCAFVRIDVPEADGVPAFTRLLGQGAIYSITFVSEEVSRGAVASIRPAPVTIYIPSLKSLPEPLGYEEVYGRPNSDFGDDENPDL
jgi:hypothetical protein